MTRFVYDDSNLPEDTPIEERRRLRAHAEGARPSVQGYGKKKGGVGSV